MRRWFAIRDTGITRARRRSHVGTFLLRRRICEEKRLWSQWRSERRFLLVRRRRSGGIACGGFPLIGLIVLEIVQFVGTVDLVRRPDRASTKHRSTAQIRNEAFFVIGCADEQPFVDDVLSIDRKTLRERKEERVDLQRSLRHWEKVCRTSLDFDLLLLQAFRIWMEWNDRQHRNVRRWLRWRTT